ncbi:C4-dicarboxylate ABC transporter substrate-binding protein [Labrenzia sp. OB1]|nr:C4-dicarboxylate ABC transporter substrate-binding protein [Labrenzia sp. OB1]
MPAHPVKPRMFQQAVCWISEVSGWTAAAMILGAVFLTCQMIFVRFVLNASTVWQTEVVVYLMVSATLVGLAFVQKHKGHVNVDLLKLSLSQKAGRCLDIVTHSAAILVIAVCLFYGYEFWHLAQSRGWTSDTVTAVPLWIPYLALPVGLGLMLLQLIADFLDVLSAAHTVEET